MLAESDVRAVLAEALRTGGDWAEVYAEQRDSSNIHLEDRRVEELTSTRTLGAAVRVVHGFTTGFAYTNVLTRESLLAAARAAAAAVQQDAAVTVADLRSVDVPTRHGIAVDPRSVQKDAKVALVRRAEQAAWEQGNEVRQVSTSYGDVVQRVFIATSDGRLSDTTRTRTRLTTSVVATRGGVTQSGFDGPGASKGLEHYDELPPEEIGTRAAQQALRLLDAVPPPAAEMTVVLKAGGGGVLFHEACGHGLEADAIAKNTTVYARTRGDRIGSEIFTGVDDGSLENGWGSFDLDDESTPAQRTTLFEAGVQVGVMSDRISAARLGQSSSGNGRRQSYAHLPLPRMTNSLILPGASDPDAIVRDVRNGLYAEGLSGGQVNPATGDFVFGVTEAYLIENGELTRRVRGASLIGNGPRAISLIDAIGTDFELKQGVCGKDGQWVPVSFGTPTLRIARLTVGGTG